MSERPVVKRRAARVLAVSPAGRVLLFEGGDPDRPHVRIWHAPGGGVEAGESDRDAAQREFLEETGLPVDLEARTCGTASSSSASTATPYRTRSRATS